MEEYQVMSTLILMLKMKNSVALVVEKEAWERNNLEDLNAIFSPGMLVRHPDRPDWGTGQVQSNIAGLKGEVITYDCRFEALDPELAIRENTAS